MHSLVWTIQPEPEIEENRGACKVQGPSESVTGAIMKKGKGFFKYSCMW